MPSYFLSKWAALFLLPRSKDEGGLIQNGQSYQGSNFSTGPLQMEEQTNCGFEILIWNEKLNDFNL